MVEVVIAGMAFGAVPLLGAGALMGFRRAYTHPVATTAAVLLGGGISYLSTRPPTPDGWRGEWGWTQVGGAAVGVGAAAAAVGCCLGTSIGYLDHGHARLRAELGTSPPPPVGTRLGVLTGWMGACAAAYMAYKIQNEREREKQEAEAKKAKRRAAFKDAQW